MVAQVYEILKTTELHTLKGKILCDSYLNKPVIQVVFFLKKWIL